MAAKAVIRRALVALCVGFATVSVALSAPMNRRVTVRTAAKVPARRTDSGVTYGSFAEAVDFWDLDAARAMAARDDQTLYLRAV